MTLGGRCIGLVLLVAPALASAQHDLLIHSVVPSTATVVSGASINVTYTVASASTAPASVNATIGTFLSNDPAITTADTSLGTDSRLLAPGQSLTVSRQVTIPSTRPTGTYYIGVFVDVGNALAESDESNNAPPGVPLAVTYNPPDLTITGLSGPASGTSGSTISVTYTVASAPGASATFTVGTAFYLSTDAVIETSDTLVGVLSASLSPGQSVTRAGSLTIPSSLPSGNYHLGAIIDHVDAIAETQEENNEALGDPVSVTFVPPDLSVTALTYPPAAAPGAGTTITYSLASAAGASPTVSVSLRFYLSTDEVITTSDTSIGTTTRTIVPGQTLTTSMSVTIPSAQPKGTYYVGAIADPANAIAETDEWNNARSGTRVIVGPDLRAMALSVPNVAAPGASVGVTDTVTNQGSAAGPFSVGLYLSPDPFITSSDSLLASRAIAGLGSAASSTGASTVTLPATATGRMYVGALADPTGQVAEADETNNALAVPVWLGIDTTPPEISILGASEGFVSGAQFVVVCADVMDANPGPVAADLDGAPLVDGCATATAEGEHVLTVHAQDLAGNVADRVVHFALDHTGPQIAVVSPQHGELIPASPAEFTVAVSDAHAIASVTVDGVAGELQADGTYRVVVALLEGLNAPVALATDVAGNASAVEAMLTLDSLQPTLQIQSPTEGAEVDGSTTVVGTVADASEVRVNVNGVPASLGSDGTFTVDIPLSHGPQLITASAVDAAGHVSTAQRSVFVPYPPLMVGVTEPTSGFRTESDQVLVRGWVQTFSPPAKVTLAALGSATAVPESDGTFTAAVAVPAGPFTIRVFATDGAGNQASTFIVGTRSVGSGADLCACDATGVCAFTRSLSLYCHDGAGNITARVSVAADEPCRPLSCPTPLQQ